MKEYYTKVALICLKGEIEEMDVWEVEMECKRQGAISTITRNKYAGNKLEVMKERSDSVKIAKERINRKFKKNQKKIAF